MVHSATSTQMASSGLPKQVGTGCVDCAGVVGVDGAALSVGVVVVAVFVVVVVTVCVVNVIVVVVVVVVAVVTVVVVTVVSVVVVNDVVVAGVVDGGAVVDRPVYGALHASQKTGHSSFRPNITPHSIVSPSLARSVHLGPSALPLQVAVVVVVVVLVVG